jgi:hypothetical protein
MSRPAAAITALVLAATPAFGPAQTIEERAARVREEMSTPPSVETVIDRGTRVIGAPPAAAAATSRSPGVDARLGAEGAQVGPDFNERMNRLLIRGLPSAQIPSTGAPPGTASVDDARGVGRSGPLPNQGRLWIKDYAPGKLVTRAGTDGQVTGTSNLITGSGVPAGPVAP